MYLQCITSLFYCLIILKLQQPEVRPDESFAMCKFTDDPLPLGSRIRSADMKVLLGKTIISVSYLD